MLQMPHIWHDSQMEKNNNNNINNKISKRKLKLIADVSASS